MITPNPATARRVTMRDIARAAAVSSAAVSYVMTGCWREKGIAPATRDRIAETARRLGYRPSRLAQGLKEGRSGLVGIIAPCVTFEFFSLIVRGIEDALSARGLTAMLMHSDEDGAREARKLDLLRRYQVEGIVVIPAGARADDKALSDLAREGVPFVLVDKMIEGANCHFVGTQDREGARAAVSHLLARGHRRIAHIRGPAGVSTSEARLAGYRDALLAAGITPDERLVVGGAWSEEAGRDAVRRLLALDPRPTALFASTDTQAWGALDALTEAGVSVPAQMAVVGFADLASSRRLAVPLTTVRQPARELGRRAGQKLLNLIDGMNDTPREVRLPTELVVRASG